MTLLFSILLILLTLFCPFTDTSAALSLLERLQRSVKESEDLKMTEQFSIDLNSLISVLESPVFKGLLNIQVRYYLLLL